MSTVDQLVELNKEIASRESSGDRPWFHQLLAPTFAMRRASGVHIDRKTFLAAVAPSAARITSEVHVLHCTDQTAIVICVVSMRQANGSSMQFRNHRLFTRADIAASWQLLGWTNEPIEPPAGSTF